MNNDNFTRAEVSWTLGMTLEDIERDVILAAFRMLHGNKHQTAAALGCSVRTIENKFAQWAQEGKGRGQPRVEANGQTSGANGDAVGVHAADGSRMEPATGLPPQLAMPVRDTRPENGKGSEVQKLPLQGHAPGTSQGRKK